MKLNRRNLLKGAIGATGIAAFGGFEALTPDIEERLGPLGTVAPSDAIRLENAKPGAWNWLNPSVEAEVQRRLTADTLHRELHETAPVHAGQALDASAIETTLERRIEGYANAMSVNTGESIGLHVSSMMGAYVISFLRLGWYGGAGATEITRTSALTGNRYPGSLYATPGWDANGVVDCKWPMAINQSTSGWTSGYYLAAFIPLSTGIPESYAPFVVRDDASTSPIVMQIPFTNYQAYNYWGGKNMYTGDDKVAATIVSFDRPYGSFAGTGHLFYGDLQVLGWLEKNDYPVTYAASSDTHNRPWLMNGRKLFLSVHHDEYWTQSMRNNAVAWVNSGKSLAMFCANNIYWRVRFASNANGLADRRMECFKGFPEGPAEKTILFSDLGQSSAFIEGVDFAGAAYDDSDWVVANDTHWIYANTGLRNGDRISGVIGGEWDTLVPQTPADTTVIATTPKLSIDYGPTQQSSVIRDVASGATVFSASSLKFGLFFGGSYARREDPSIVKITKNLFGHLGISPGSQPPTPTTTTPSNTTPGSRPRVAVGPAEVATSTPRQSAGQSAGATPTPRQPASSS